MQDYTIEEIVPSIDAGYRTISNRDGRGIAGEMAGACGAQEFYETSSAGSVALFQKFRNGGEAAPEEGG
jgi:hypothetical protein